MTSAAGKQDGLPMCDADARQCTSSDNRSVSGNDTDNAKSSQTSWLYQCMISKCSASFDRLTDFRMHFMVSHQPGSVFDISCCYL